MYARRSRSALVVTASPLPTYSLIWWNAVLTGLLAAIIGAVARLNAENILEILEDEETFLSISMCKLMSTPLRA